MARAERSGVYIPLTILFDLLTLAKKNKALINQRLFSFWDIAWGKIRDGFCDGKKRWNLVMGNLTGWNVRADKSCELDAAGQGRLSTLLSMLATCFLF